KPMMAGGFLAIGTAAFLQGSLIVSSDYDHFALVLRGVGIIAALAGSVSWTASPNARAFLWVGLALLAGALAIEANRASSAADALLTAGAVGIGIAVLYVSRRSIAARVAATAAGALLLLVLVLSLALSSVLSSTVQREAFQRLNGRAAQEASSVTKSTTDVVTQGAVYATLIGRTHTDEVLRLAQDSTAVNQPDQPCARLVPGLGSAPPTIGQCIQSDVSKLQQKKSIALAYLAGGRDGPAARGGQVAGRQGSDLSERVPHLGRAGRQPGHVRGGHPRVSRRAGHARRPGQVPRRVAAQRRLPQRSLAGRRRSLAGAREPGRRARPLRRPARHHDAPAAGRSGPHVGQPALAHRQQPVHVGPTGVPHRRRQHADHDARRVDADHAVRRHQAAVVPQPVPHRPGRHAARAADRVARR